jgi:hypothetical protein
VRLGYGYMGLGLDRAGFNEIAITHTVTTVSLFHCQPCYIYYSYERLYNCQPYVINNLFIFLF